VKVCLPPARPAPRSSVEQGALEIGQVAPVGGLILTAALREPKPGTPPEILATMTLQRVLPPDSDELSPLLTVQYRRTDQVAAASAGTATCTSSKPPGSTR
jgi:hypothetical protein